MDPGPSFLFDHDRRRRDRLIELFGSGRFTANDLWSKRDKRPSFPTQEYVASERAWLDKMPFIEDAPGPRGGKGYRVSPHVVEEVRRQRADAADEKARRNGPHRAAAGALSSRFAQIELDDVAFRVKITWPNVGCPSSYSALRWSEFARRPLNVADIVEATIREGRFRRKLRSISVADSSRSIFLQWSDAQKAAELIEAVDAAIVSELDRSTRWLQERLVAIDNYHQGRAPP